MEISQQSKSLLQILNNWEKVNHAYSLYTFHEMQVYDDFQPFEYVNEWFGFNLAEKEPGNEFIQFASDPTGGVFALWHYPTLKGEPPVVLLGSEGEVRILAPTMVDFLCLLANYECLSAKIDDEENPFLWYVVYDFQLKDAVEDRKEFASVSTIQKAIQKEMTQLQSEIQKNHTCRNTQSIIADYERHPNLEKWIEHVVEKNDADQIHEPPSDPLVLDLSGQDLEKIPNSILDNPYLKSIDLSDNQITEIPDFFQKLKTIIHIDLSDNQLSKIPTFFEDFVALKNLDLTDNQITELNFDFTKMRSLHHLDIGGNPIDIKGVQNLFKSKSIYSFFYSDTKLTKEVSHLELISKFEAEGILDEVENEEYNELHRKELSQKDLALIEQIYQKRILLFPSSKTYYDYAYFFQYKLRDQYEKAIPLYEECLRRKDDDEFEATMYTEFGRLYYHRLERDLDKAEILFAKAVEEDDECEYCIDMYASFLTFRKDDYKKAEKLRKHLLRLDPSDISHLEDYYDLLGYMKKPKKQLKILKKLKTLEPYKRKWRKKYAELLVSEFDKHQKAAKIFKKILKEKKSSDNYWNYLNALENSQADKELILATYKKALDKYPNDEFLNDAFSYFQIQYGETKFVQTRIKEKKASEDEIKDFIDHLIEKKDFAQAKQLANDATEQFPKNKWIFLQYIDILKELGEQKDVLIKLLNDNHIIDPIQLSLKKVQILMDTDSPKEEVIPVIKTIISQTDDPTVKRQFEVLLNAKTKDYENLAEYNELVASANGNLEQLGKEIMTAFKEKDYRKAKAIVREMERIDPYEYNMLRTYAGLLAMIENPNAGIEFLKNKLEKSTPNVNVLLVLIEVHYQLQKIVEAEKWIEIANNHHPNNETVQEYVKQLKEEAEGGPNIESIEIKLKNDPKNIDILMELGVTFFDTQQFQKATKVFKKVITIDDQNILAYLNIAIGYFVSGNNKKESIAYEKALKIDALSTLSFFVNRRDIDNFKKYAPKAKLLFPDDERLITWIDGMNAVI